MIRDQNLRINFICELRFVAADDSWMSPAFGRDTCQMGCYQFQNRSLEPYFDGFEKIAVARGGRPHWGKEFSINADTISTLFPEYQRFAQIRAQLDPNGLFQNAFSKRMITM